MAQFRKSKTFGGLRFTVGKRGVSTSFGSGPLRVSLSSDGKVRRTIRAPGTGVYDTKIIGERQPTSIQPDRHAAPKKRHPWLLTFLVVSFAFLLIMILI